MNVTKAIRSVSLPALALLAATTALSTVIAPRDAAAACCVAYDYGYEGMEHAKTQAVITAKITEMEIALIEALRLATGQLSGNLKEQVAAQASMEDLKDKREVQRRIEDETLAATGSLASGASTCNVISGGLVARNLDAQSVAWREDLVRAQVGWDAGEVGASRLGTRQANEKRLETHCRLYGTEGDKESGLCKVVGPNPGADINANTILGAKNGVLTPEEADAAVLFLATALQPRPLGALAKGAANQAGGRELVAKRHASIARSSVATTTAAAIASNRVAFDQEVVGEGGEAESLVDWAEGTAKQTLGYNPNGGNFPHGVSKNAWLELRAKAWFMNPNWAVRVDTQNVDRTAKDLAMMQAFQVYQNWEQYKLLEQMNLSLATMLSILEDKNREKL